MPKLRMEAIFVKTSAAEEDLAKEFSEKEGTAASAATGVELDLLGLTIVQIDRQTRSANRINTREQAPKLGANPHP